uniref:Uncharacterized protein n=1 Tax=Hyaloperonospora arabidopsidis (strain Emoy2) TaxID=559515 RepID=M4BCX6_HYAAE
MNRLLQHFVDSNGAPHATASSRPPVPLPPQSSGGSYHGSSRGSYQRAAPGSPFFYQPAHAGASGLAEIPLTSSSSGAKYETVDLNADSLQEQGQQQLVVPNHRLFHTEGIGFHTKGASSGDAHVFRGESVVAGPEVAGRFSSGASSTETGQLTTMESTLTGEHKRGTEPNGTIDTTLSSTCGLTNGPVIVPYSSRRDVSGTSNAMSAMDNAGLVQEGQDLFPRQTVQNGSSTTMHMDENGNGFNNTGPCAATEVWSQVSDPAQLSEKETGYQRRDQHQLNGQSTMAEPFGSASFHVDKNPFESPAITNEDRQCQHLPSADSLFVSPPPMNNGGWPHATPFAQQASKPVQAQALFASGAPTASSLFNEDASMPSRASQIAPPRVVTKALPLPRHPQNNLPSSSTRSPAMPPATVVPPMTKSSDVGTPPLPIPDVVASASSAMRPDDHYTRAVGSRRLSAPAESAMKFGLDVRHMKFPAGKREDDAISNAPSMAQSRMSMLSTLDDSLKLSDMYKHMTTRLQSEKQDLLKVVSNQAQEIAQLNKHIKSLELQMKKQHLA